MQEATSDTHVCTTCGKPAHARRRRTLEERLRDAVAQPAPLPPLRGEEEAAALVALQEARETYDAAKERRFQAYDDLYPELRDSIVTSPRWINADGALEKADETLRIALVRFNELERARERADRAAAASEAEHVATERSELREMERARRASSSVGSRIRRLLGGDA